MKKILLAFVIVGLTTTAFSQIKVRPGLRGGINISKITNIDGDSRTDFYLGGYVGIKLARFYTIQPELTYSRQGGQVWYSYYDPIDPYFPMYEKDDLEIQYLNLAIVNKFHPIPDAGLNFIVGPSFNIKVADNYDDPYDDIEGFDIALFGGIGYEFPMGFGIEARYNLGLVDIFGENINNEVDVDELWLNSYFQIGATYKFDF